MINSISGYGERALRPSEEGGRTHKTKDAKNTGAVESVQTKSQDKVELSAEAKDRLTIRQHLGDQDTARAQKVDALRQQIQAGTYRIDAEQVAQKIQATGL